jgi:hypothetical protein
MTQPPGPFGDHGRPGPCPQGAPGAGPLPWLIVGGAVLVSGIGIVLVVLLTRDGDPTPASDHHAAAGVSPASPSTPAPASPSREAAEGNLPGGARVVEPAAAEGGQFPGSGEVARTWVQAMADGDFQTAYDLSCAEVQEVAVSGDDGSGPAWFLAGYFFEQTLGGVGFTEGTFDGVEYSAESDRDVASFTLQLDNGEEFLLLVYVDPALSVCDFD